MAKLNGVKTLDMVNGEITRVEYDGETYVKVDGKAQAGDIGRRLTTKSGVSAEVGAFYEITKVSGRGVGYVDDDEDNCTAKDDKFSYYRKDSAAGNDLTDRVASLESRVDKLEGKANGQREIYRLVTDRKPKAGDFVKFSETDYGDLTIGKYYEVTGVDSDGDLKIIDDRGDSSCAVYFDEVFEVYEKVSANHPAEQITHNGATYTLVDRKAQPGDVVVFANDDNPDWLIRGGKPYLVTKVVNDEPSFIGEDETGYDVYHAYYNRTPANVKVYAPVKALEQKAEPLKEENTALRIGDYVKVISLVRIDGETRSDVNIGDIGKIIEVDGTNIPYRFERLSDGYITWFKTDGVLTRATDEEVVAAKAEAHKALFKNGDYAKLLSTKGSLRGFSAGEIVKVTDINNTGASDFEVNSGRKYGYTNADNLVKASEEEIAKAEQSAKWARIGREPNEFKKGDIVRLLEDSGANEKGEIVEIAEDGAHMYYDECGDKYGSQADWFELVTPVEARFDRE